jgi:hypothetical protein
VQHDPSPYYKDVITKHTYTSEFDNSIVYIRQRAQLGGGHIMGSKTTIFKPAVIETTGQHITF